jgi:outer membrane lipoprotein-sorting protein
MNRVTCDVRRAMGDVRRATCYVLRATCYVLGATCYVLGVAAQAPDARQVVQEAQKRTVAKSQRYEGLLQTFEAAGKTSEKKWIYERIGSHGQSKVLIRFTEPPEVRGVALLIVNHPDKASDQWMWTPALERDRRIALQDRSTRFFGTDFSFEDLEERDVDQSTYRLLGEESIDGAAAWKIESTPKEARSSQYTKQMLWVRKDNYAWARIDSYVNDDVVRRLEYKNLKNVQGIWTAHELVMTDLRRASITRLALEKVEYNVPLRDGDFTVEALRRK